MLMQIRERASGIVAYIIVILISIPFALWGIQEYLGGGSDQIVAEVGDTEITKRIFDSQVQEQRSRLRSILGQSFDALYQDEALLKQSVLDNLIENTLVNDETLGAGYKISNSQLFERIKSVPQFQVDGQFNQTRYDQLLASQRRGKVEFEEQLRQEERINQYQRSVVFSSFLPSGDKAQFASLRNQKRQFDYFFIQVDVDPDKISPADINAYYESQKENFKTPAKVKLEYIKLLQQDIADAMEFNENEIIAAYEDDPDRYRTAELRKASHILFKTSDNASEQEVAQAFEKAQEAANQIKEGKSFAEVAKEFSDDSVSADKGGDLGFLSRTDIDNPEFVNKLFALQVGEISEPVRTKLGVQIIRLSEITPSKLRPLAEVRSKVENELRSREAEKEFVKRAERLQDLSYENEDNLDVVAENLGMKVEATDWVATVTDEGITSFQKVMTAAFSDEVLNKRYNSELLELADGHVAVIRVTEFQDAEFQSQEEVAESIKTTLVIKKEVEQATEKGQSVVAKLMEAPLQLSTLATENGYSVESSGELLRDDQSLPSQLMSHVFSMPAPKDTQAVVDGLQLSDGRYAVIRLNRVEAPDTNVEQAEWISMQGRYGRREMSAMLKALRQASDVRINTENM